MFQISRNTLRKSAQSVLIRVPSYYPFKYANTINVVFTPDTPYSPQVNRLLSEYSSVRQNK